MRKRTIDISESLFEVEQADPAFERMARETREKMQRKKRQPKTVAAAVFRRALDEVDVMMRTGDWSGASARHLVALYDRLHARCYGVEPAELGPTERFNAGMLAGGLVKREFAGDVVSAVEFMHWVWEREIEREEWRRQNGRDGGRIGVRLMFCGALLTDYRVHLARTGRSA